jgi:Domain of unknown function (DUF4220)/Protein of unknown function, DUF594
MANIHLIVESFLLIMQTNDAILARIEFMVVANSILLLILFTFDTYRRRSRSRIVKYILLVVDAASHSMVLHTIGLMQSAPLRNGLFEIWAILLVALRFSINYITVYGLQGQGRVQWNVEFGAALMSFTWAGKLNGTRNSDFRIPLWTLWALQPLRVGYMYFAYYYARMSYWQGRSSVLVSDYMEAENGSMDSEANSEVGPSSENRVSNQKDEPRNTVQDAEGKEENLITNPQSVTEKEQVGQQNRNQEELNCNLNAEARQGSREDVRTNVEEPNSSGSYDPSSMRGYRYLIQGETWQEVEPKRLEDKLQLRITREEKLITLDKIWQCKGKLLGEWGDKNSQLKYLCLSFALYRLLRCRFDDYPLPEASIPKTRGLLLENILCRIKNAESVKEGNRRLEDATREGTECSEEQQEDTEVENNNANRQQDDYNAEKNEDEDEVKEEVADQVFEITGTELSFLHDYMYSRFPVIFWSGIGLLFSLSLYIAVVATTIWVGISVVHVYTPPEGNFSHVIHGYNVDAFITWGILLFIVFKETWEILIYLFSDWTKVVLISAYVEHTCMENWLVENFIWLLCKCSMVGRWHGKIDQYNFLEAYDYKPPICNLAYYLSLGSLPKAADGVDSKGQFVLPKEVKKAIVKSICSLKDQLKMGHLPAGMSFILKRNNLIDETSHANLSEEISQMGELHKLVNELHTCSHIILVWHIATSLCELELCRNYNVYLSDSELPSLLSFLNCCSSKPFLVKEERLDKVLRKNFTVANSLSQYCAHLLIKQPDLLPDHIFIPEEVFQHTVQEARDVLEGCDSLQTIYGRLINEGGKSKNENTIMRQSARLGKMLIENLDEAARWKALAGIWADMLVYIAPNSNVEAHEECLATGGEFITHVWILLYHAGILENSLVNQEENNDIENP